MKYALYRSSDPIRLFKQPVFECTRERICEEKYFGLFKKCIYQRTIHEGVISKWIKLPWDKLDWVGFKRIKTLSKTEFFTILL